MTNPKIPTVSVEELKKLKQGNPNLLLIDVREPHEWKALRIPWAAHIPKDKISTNIQTICQEKNTPIYLHCKSGVRSTQAAQTLNSLGYSKVFSVEGGIMDWALSGFEVEEG